MKTNTLLFQTENDYLQWESEKGNTIYALQDMQGRYIGDIKESNLIPLWDSGRITSLDNPKNKEQLLWNMENINELGEANWSITNDNDKGIFDKLVIIKIG